MADDEAEEVTVGEDDIIPIEPADDLVQSSRTNPPEMQYQSPMGPQYQGLEALRERVRNIYSNNPFLDAKFPSSIPKFDQMDRSELEALEWSANYQLNGVINEHIGDVVLEKVIFMLPIPRKQDLLDSIAKDDAFMKMLNGCIGKAFAAMPIPAKLLLIGSGHVMHHVTGSPRVKRRRLENGGPSSGQTTQTPVSPSDIGSQPVRENDSVNESINQR